VTYRGKKWEGCGGKQKRCKERGKDGGVAINSTGVSKRGDASGGEQIKRNNQETSKVRGMEHLTDSIDYNIKGSRIGRREEGKRTSC